MTYTVIAQIDGRPYKTPAYDAKHAIEIKNSLADRDIRSTIQDPDGYILSTLDIQRHVWVRYPKATAWTD